MRQALKAIGFIVLGVVLSIICFFLSIEAYWPFAPHIDTRFSKDFSIDKFENISIGSSIEEVRSTLGEPIWKEGCGGCWEKEYYMRNNLFMFPQSRKCDAPCQSDNQRWQFSDDGACTWWDFAWEYYAIDFDQGKVVAKYVQWHGD
jgi:hypothetical protein